MATRLHDEVWAGVAAKEQFCEDATGLHVKKVREAGVVEMTKFIDAIDRMFDELIHEAWRSHSRPLPEPPSRTSIEFKVPLPVTRFTDVGFHVAGDEVTITASSQHRETKNLPGIQESSEGRYRQVLTLPPGTEPSGFDVRFEAGGLQIRVGLRSRVRG